MRTNSTEHFTYDSDMSYAEFQRISHYTIDEIKNRVYHYIDFTCDDSHNYLVSEPNEYPDYSNRVLLKMLTEFYFYYATKKGVNPLVPLIQSINETTFFTYNDCILDQNSKNTAGIKIDNKIRSNYCDFIREQTGNSVEDSITDNYKWAHKYFRSWTDSIRAQIDHLLLFQMKDTCASEDNLLSHLTFDPEHNPDLVCYLGRDDGNGHEYTTGNLSEMFGGNGIGSAYSTVGHGNKLLQRMNLIACDYIVGANDIDQYELDCFSSANYNNNIDYSLSPSEVLISFRPLAEEISLLTSAERTLTGLTDDMRGLISRLIVASR